MLRVRSFAPAPTNGYSHPDGPDVCAAALYGYTNSADNPRNDHLWGYGSVANDSPGATTRILIWTGT